MRHNERIGNEGKGGHIDERRQQFNRDLLGNSSKDAYLDIVNRLTGKNYTSKDVPEYGKDVINYKDGTKVRKGSTEQYDTVLAFETEMRYPGDMIWSTFDKNGKAVPLPDATKIDSQMIRPIDEGGKGYFLMPKDKKEFDDWCDSATGFLKKKFGEKNVLSVQLHMDEGEPHIHGLVTPIVADKKGTEKLSYKHFFGERDSLVTLQTEYSKSVKHLGYKRGEFYSTRGKSMSTKEYKARIVKIMEAEIPDDLEECKEQIRDLRAQK